MGFTKLDEGIVRSSVWSEAYPTRILFVTMLAMCNSKGFVASSRSGLVRESNITEPEFAVGIAILEAPDKDSRSPEFEGRRVEKCIGGWSVLNYPKYRNYSYSSSPEAVRQRKHRAKPKGRDGSLRVTKGRDISASASVLSYPDLREDLEVIEGTVGGDLGARRVAAEAEFRREKEEEGKTGFELEEEVGRMMKIWDANQIKADRLRKERIAK